MTATNKPYTDLDTVKSLLDTTATTRDDLIESWITQAQAAVDSYLGFNFQTDTSAKLYDGNGRQKILVDKCLSLTQVEVLSYSVVSNVRTITDTQDISGYCLLDRTGIVLERVSGGYFPLGRNNIRVTGTFGRRALVPDDIQRATALLAVHYAKQQDSSYQDQTGDSQYGVLVFRQQMPKDVCEILDKYQRRYFSS